MKHSIFIIVLLLGSSISSVNAEQIHKIAVRTHSGIEAGKKKWQPTIDYLSKAIAGHRFEMIVYPHLDKQLEDARQKKFEFILTNPATYIEIKHLVGASALLTLINKRHGSRQTRFGSVIFTRADRDDIIELQDLKGKHLKAVSPLAFGGWRIAWREMLQNDFAPYSDLGQLSFANGNQPAVVAAVRAGEADAGVVRTDMLERLYAQGTIKLADFRIIHTLESKGFPFFHSTSLYPEWPFAVMADVSDELSAQVKLALLNVKENDVAARQGQYIGWTEALDYQSVEELLTELSLVPHQNSAASRINIHYYYPVGILILLFIILFAFRKSSDKQAPDNGQ